MNCSYIRKSRIIDWSCVYMCCYVWIYVWIIMDMQVWNSAIDECLNVWVIFVIVDVIYDEIMMDWYGSWWIQML